MSHHRWRTGGAGLRGGGADTNGAIGGVALGARFGETEIPEDWLDALPPAASAEFGSLAKRLLAAGERPGAQRARQGTAAVSATAADGAAAELERLVAEDDRLQREAGADYGNAAALRRMAAEARRAGRGAVAGVLERAAAGEPEAGDADGLRRMLAAGAGPRIAPMRSRSPLAALPQGGSLAEPCIIYLRRRQDLQGRHA